MNYKVIKYKKVPFETYKPEKRADMHKGKVVYLMINVWHALLVFGGLIGFLFSSAFISIKEFLGIKKKIQGAYRSKSNYKTLKHGMIVQNFRKVH